MFCLKNIGYYVWATNDIHKKYKCFENQEKKYDQKVTDMLIQKIKSSDSLRKLDLTFYPETKRKFYNKVILSQDQLDLLTFAIQTLGDETNLDYDKPQVHLF